MKPSRAIFGRKPANKGQPQERQHSAASWRDAGPTAPGERLKSDFTTRWYQFCNCDIVSMLCTSMHGVRTNTEPVFIRGRHGQESKEGKEDRESHQEGGKEDVKKEVVVSTTEIIRLRIKTGRKTNLFKGSERRFARIQISKRGKVRSDLCADGGGCVKVRFFVCALARGDLLLPRRIDAARPRRSCGAVHESLVRECGRAHHSRFA